MGDPAKPSSSARLSLGRSRTYHNPKLVASTPASFLPPANPNGPLGPPRGTPVGIQVCYTAARSTPSLGSYIRNPNLNTRFNMYQNRIPGNSQDECGRVEMTHALTAIEGHTALDMTDPFGAQDRSACDALRIRGK